MSIDQIVSLLVSERDRLNRAIDALGGVAPKRRGRPPKSASTVSAETPQSTTAPARKARTAAQKKAHSERMRAYWAKRRAAAKKG